jgi:hypothetical protein
MWCSVKSAPMSSSYVSIRIRTTLFTSWKHLENQLLAKRCYCEVNTYTFIFISRHITPHYFHLILYEFQKKYFQFIFQMFICEYRKLPSLEDRVSRFCILSLLMFLLPVRICIWRLGILPLHDPRFLKWSLLSCGLLCNIRWFDTNVSGFLKPVWNLNNAVQDLHLIVFNSQNLFLSSVSPDLVQLSPSSV